MSSDVLELTKENFESNITNASKPVMVDLWAEWCMPCKMLSPVVDEIAKDYKDKINVAKLNVDDHPELATQLSVMNIPTLIFFKAGKEEDRIVGVKSKEDIEAKIQELI